jgi:hypothetical protein
MRVVCRTNTPSSAKVPTMPQVAEGYRGRPRDLLLIFRVIVGTITSVGVWIFSRMVERTKRHLWAKLLLIQSILWLIVRDALIPCGSHQLRRHDALLRQGQSPHAVMVLGVILKVMMAELPSGSVDQIPEQEAQCV